MFAEMLEFLSADGWPVRPGTYDGLPCIDTRFLGTDLAWDCRARPYDPFGQLAFESVLPVPVPPSSRTAMADLVVRTNWRLLTGAFQFDPDTGDLAFRSMIFLSHGAPVTDELCRGLVYGNVLTVDRCVAAFVTTAAGGDVGAAVRDLAL